MSLTMLSACQPDTSTNHQVYIDQDTIILNKNDVIAIKPERYQPSFRLEGVLAPIAQATLTLPTDATLQTLHVKAGDTVKKGDKIATFYQSLAQTPTTNLDDDSIINYQTQPSENDQIHQMPSLPPSQTQNIATNIQTIGQDIAIITPIFGKVQNIFTQPTKTRYAKGEVIADIVDDRQLVLVNTLPSRFVEHVHIGDAVSFSTKDGRLFNGQIAKIIPDTKHPQLIDIHLYINHEEIKKAHLHIGEMVSSYIEYGQISLGTLVPAEAIFDKDLKPMSLQALYQPPYKPATPIHAFLWMIGQNEQLTLLSIEVIEYFPKNKRFLVAGVSLDGLIVATKLPKSAQTKQVRLR